MNMKFFWMIVAQMLLASFNSYCPAHLFQFSSAPKENEDLSHDEFSAGLCLQVVSLIANNILLCRMLRHHLPRCLEEKKKSNGILNYDWRYPPINYGNIK